MQPTPDKQLRDATSRRTTRRTFYSGIIPQHELAERTRFLSVGVLETGEHKEKREKTDSNTVMRKGDLFGDCTLKYLTSHFHILQEMHMCVICDKE